MTHARVATRLARSRTLTRFATALLALVLAARPAGADEARVESLLVRLTPDEKLGLLAGEGFEAHGVARFGIPPLTMTDGPAGVRWGESTAFPSPIALAATWDTALVARVADAMAREALAKGRRVLLAPCVNIARCPNGGRTFEGYGEDPYLTGRIATAFVRGLQSRGVAASVKHFAANSQEANRGEVDEQVSERALREIELPGFEAAVREGGAWTVMTAYNKLNGAWYSENRWLLRDVLEHDWGFDGLVLSDWGAVHSTVPTLDAGLHLEMPDHRWLDAEHLRFALANHTIPEATIDEGVRRLLRVLDRSGALDANAAPPAPADERAARALAREAAARSLVLLRDEAAALPLDRAHLRSLAVIGPNAAVARTGGGGSSFVSTREPSAPLDAVRRAAGAGVRVTFAPGVRLPGEIAPLDSSTLVPASGAGHGLTAEYFANADLAGPPVLVRTDPSVHFDWGDGAPAPGMPVDHYSARWTGSFVPPSSGAYEVAVRADDGVRLWLDGALVLDDWSDHGARTVARTVPMKAGRAVAVKLEFYENGGAAVVAFGIRRLSGDPLREAVAAAKRADAAIVFVGNSSDVESEGFDRDGLALPEGQDALVRAIAAANPRTIVVVIAGAPVEMPWLERVPAIVQAWFPGCEGGDAIASVLFGDAEPAGRLPISFPRRWADASSAASYSSHSLVARNDDGVFVGYRHLDRAGIAPAFAFGHGLSYTTFRYSDLAVEPVANATGPAARVRFTVTNTGARRGVEVAQLYVEPPASALPRPPRELERFARVELAPGESAHVALELDARAFAAFDDAAHAWRVAPGTYTIRVGASSRDLRLSQSLSLEAWTASPLAARVGGAGFRPEEGAR